MKKIRILSISVIVTLLFLSCEKQTSEDAIPENVIVPSGKIDLWNGTDFSGWVRFVPDSQADVDTVWRVVDSVIHCTGVPNGYIRTEKEYANYKLSLEWRWTGEPGNSGVLLHMSLPDKVWPRSIEAQLKTQNAGDIWLFEDTEVAEHVNKESKLVAKQSDVSENPAGEWNKYEIYCKDKNITMYVNGVLQNKATKASEYYGKICFQSEGKPIQFRNIVIEPVE